MRINKTRDYRKMANCAVGVMMVILAAYVFFSWTTWRDGQITKAADAYNDCMVAKTGKTAAAWYADNGYYPECR